MSFKNATRGKQLFFMLSCVLTVLQIQIHIRKILLLQHHQQGVLGTSPCNTLQQCRYEDVR